MMNTYEITMVTKATANDYFSGGYNYESDIVRIKADNKDQAKEIATKKNADFIVVKVEDVKEIEAREKAVANAIAKENERKAKAQATRKANEEKKACEMGMTVEEYRKYKAIMSRKTKAENEIAKMQQQIYYAQKKIAKYEKEIANMTK